MVHIDGYLKQRLENIKKIIKKNFDALIIIDGKERIGKSTLGLAIGSYLDSTFNVNNIAADAEDCVDKIEHLPDKSILMVDEGSLSLSSKDSMKKEQKKLIKILNVVGQKNMVFIVILPSFFELNKYVATDRARFLIHCYSDKQLNRGRFAYFGTNKLKKLYEYGRKNFGSYRYPKADFIGRFSKYTPDWYDEYLKTKQKSLLSAIKEPKKALPSGVKEAIMRDYLVGFRKNCPDITIAQLSKGFGISKRSIYRHLSIAKGVNPDE